jgi:hypothetical protein
MMRGTWVIRGGEVVEKGGPLDIRPLAAHSDMPCPMLISDHMPECEHVDGKFYSSKSAYRRVTKENGLLEVGNEKLRPKPKASQAERDKGIDQAIDRAISRAS